MATEILVAARDLPVGTKLQPDDVKLARWPRDSVPSGSITDAHTVVDSIVKSEMVQGEYQINKRWSVSAARDQLGGVSVDGRYHTRF